MDGVQIVHGHPLTSCTVIVTVAAFDVEMPSVAVYVKLSSPLNDAFDVYVNEPLAFRLTLPCAGAAPRAALSGFPLPETSFPSTAQGMAFGRSGNLYISDFGIRKLSPDGTISTIAGTGTPGYSGDGGPATGAQVNPGALAIDSAGSIYLTDTANNVVRVLQPANLVPPRPPGARRGRK